MQLHKKQIQIENYSISFLDNENKDKKILLFVHGWSADKYNLKIIYDKLLNTHRIISIDLPGFGESTLPNFTIGTKEYAECIISFLNKLNISNVNYVGHSLGGKIGIYIAAIHSNFIKRLVLINSSGLKAKRYPSWYFKVNSYKFVKFVLKNIIKDNNRLEKLKTKFGSDDYKNAGKLRNILVKLTNENFLYLLKKIKCPVFLYWGDKDKSTPIWMAKKMEKEIPDAALYIVKDGDHFSFLKDLSIISIIKSFAV